jgi:hypothetical protein
VSQLLLGSSWVTGLLHVMDAHGMAGGMGSAALHPRMETDIVPECVDE